MNILILEDDLQRVRYFIERFGHHNLKITENASSAIDYLKKYVFDCIFLDNDLGLNNGSGTDVASFLYNNQRNLNNKSRVIVHSWNAGATESILSKIPNAIQAPFNTEIFLEASIDI